MLTAQDSIPSSLQKIPRERFFNSVTIAGGANFFKLQRTADLTVAITSGGWGCIGLGTMFSVGGGVEATFNEESRRGLTIERTLPKIYAQNEVFPGFGYRLDVLYDLPSEQYTGALFVRPGLGLALGVLDAYYSYTFRIGISSIPPMRSSVNLRLKIPFGIGNWSVPGRPRLPYY